MIATAALNETAKSAWCREQGLYPSDLEAWRDQAIAALATPAEVRARPEETRKDRRRIQELEREMRRKDKALAETAALLVLSKKLSAILERARRQIALNDRQTLAQNIRQAQAAGARLHAACALAGIDSRTLQRWERDSGLTHGDRRPGTVRKTPAHALSAAERARILAVANDPRFAEMPPARIVPKLVDNARYVGADEGVYIASESTFSRVLRSAGQTRHRGRAKTLRPTRPPTTHVATGPRQVWCWDMTYLPAEVTGRWFYLYLILDLYSRKIVGYTVADTDDAGHAAHLARRTALAEGIHGLHDKPVLHGDNGATLKATTVLAMLHWLGVKPSYSRPRVSNDNAFVESLFRTAKYRPEFPERGFADLESARTWAATFVHWYNHDHAHSGIRYVSPALRHAGEDIPILAARHALYQEAKARHPRRRSGPTRNWSPRMVVTLKPERKKVGARGGGQRCS